MTKKEIKAALDLLKQEQNELIRMSREADLYKRKLNEKIHKYGTAILILESKL